MKRSSLILAGLLATAVAHADWWELRVSDLRHPVRGERCLQLLSLLGGRMTPDSVFHVSVHQPSSVRPLLRAAGATTGETRRVVEILRELRENPPDHEPLRAMFRRLRNPGFDNRLFLCVAGAGCVLNGADAIYDPVMLNFEVVDTFGPLADLPVPRTQSVAGLRREMNVILVRLPVQYPAEFRPVIFVANLFHEMQHFMDNDLMSAWVSANRRLLRAGLRPDPMFERFIRLIHPGRPTETLMVLQSFWTTFLESRNYGTTAAIYRRNLTPERFTVINRDLRENAMADIEEDGGVPLLTEEGLDATSFEQIGDRWADRMRETIRRASALR